MNFLSIDLIRQHLRIDHNEEDSLLGMYADAAEQTVLSMLNRTLDDLRLEGGGDIPTPVMQAALLLVGESYRNREASSPQQLYSVPYGVDRLLLPFRNVLYTQ